MEEDSQPQIVGTWKELEAPQHWNEMRCPQLANLGSGSCWKHMQVPQFKRYRDHNAIEHYKMFQSISF
uniref:Uncharacterized protein n=1 Tax=Oryza barthii TaxID=65489 RepID=A0A0D3GUA2_9ORYZ